VESLAAKHCASAGVNRNEFDSDSHLAGFERAEFDVANFEAIRRRLTGRTANESDSTGGGHRAIVARDLSAGRSEAPPRRSIDHTLREFSFLSTKSRRQPFRDGAATTRRTPGDP